MRYSPLLAGEMWIRSLALSRLTLSELALLILCLPTVLGSQGVAHDGAPGNNAAKSRVESVNSTALPDWPPFGAGRPLIIELKDTTQIAAIQYALIRLVGPQCSRRRHLEERISLAPWLAAIRQLGHVEGPTEAKRDGDVVVARVAKQHVQNGRVGDDQVADLHGFAFT